MADYKQPSTELIGENELVGDFSRQPFAHRMHHTN